MEINILIDEAFRRRLTRRWLRAAAAGALAASGAGDDVELGLFITSDEGIRALNRQYRGRDEPTDVLAFAAREEAVAGLSFISPPDGLTHLGEVIIAYPQARAQARAHRHPVKTEVAVLIVHGVLHLLGYDHERPGPERRMRAKEAKVTAQLKEADFESSGHRRQPA